MSATAPGLTTVEIAAGAGVNQMLSATVVHPFRDVPALVCDVGGQGGPDALHTTAGVTVRTGGRQVEGGHFGVRLGAIGGLGDVGGVSRLEMPFAGAELAFQGGAAWGEGLGAFTVNLGAQVMYPLTDTEYATKAGTGTGVTTAVPIPGYYVYLDTRVDAPLGDHAAFIVGAGLDVGIGVFFPRGALGVRFAPGRGAQR